jgi:hypothetical protein
MKDESIPMQKIRRTMPMMTDEKTLRNTNKNIY